MPRLTRLAVMLVLLCACQAPPERPSAPEAEARVPWENYEQIEPSQGRVFRLDAESSEVQIYVYRAGALAARGHNHVVHATALEGAVFVPGRGKQGARFDLVIAADGLAVDDLQVRRSLGHSFGAEVDDEAREDTRANMLGPAVLDAEQFPHIGVASRAIAGELPKLVVATALTLRGVTEEQWTPVDVQVEGDRLVAEGALAIRQSDFGIEPFAALGGLLRVADFVMIEFRLVGSAE